MDEIERDEADAEQRWVGPVLNKSAESLAVLRAIIALNPEVKVVDRGAYIRVRARLQCRVTRLEVERELGSEFDFPSDLERVMPSFEGNFAVTARDASWSVERAK